MRVKRNLLFISFMDSHLPTTSVSGVGSIEGWNLRMGGVGVALRGILRVTQRPEGVEPVTDSIASGDRYIFRPQGLI